jgi:hypothetical protein
VKRGHLFPLKKEKSDEINSGNLLWHIQNMGYQLTVLLNSCVLSPKKF